MSQNFEKNLEIATDEELLRWINNYSFQVTPLASDELTRRKLKELYFAFQSYNKQSSQQTEKLIKLTWWIVGLTITMIICAIVQIILALLAIIK